MPLQRKYYALENHNKRKSRSQDNRFYVYFCVDDPVMLFNISIDAERIQRVSQVAAVLGLRCMSRSAICTIDLTQLLHLVTLYDLISIKLVLCYFSKFNCYLLLVGANLRLYYYCLNDASLLQINFLDIQSIWERRNNY